MDPTLVNPVTGMPIGQELFGDNVGTYFPTYQGVKEGPVFQAFSGPEYELDDLVAREQEEIYQTNRAAKKEGTYDGKPAYETEYKAPTTIANIRFNKALKEAKKQGNFTKE